MPCPTISLIEPVVHLRDSYVSLVREFVDGGERMIPFVLGFEHGDFEGLVRRFQDCRDGLELPPGFVPHTTYWLVQDGNQILEVSNLRHALTPKLEREGGHIGYGVRPTQRGKGYGTVLLARTIEVARDRGLARVLLTVRKTNTLSVRVILRNGGVLASEELIPEQEGIVQRYWIDIPNPDG